MIFALRWGALRIMLKLSEQLKQFYDGLRYIYFGTGDFAVPPLSALLDAGAKPLAVVTAPDEKTGREQTLTPSPIKEELQRLTTGVSLWQPDKLDDMFARNVKNSKVDIAIVADYGKIIPQTALTSTKYGFLNIHPSLLPKYRGASPIEGAILGGEVETGVTIIHMDAEVDHGPIVTRRKTKIRGQETARELEARLAHLGASLLLRILPRYMAGKIQPGAQNHDTATFTKMLSREDGKISFAEDAETIIRQLRAFTPWPGIYTIWKRGSDEKRLKILEAVAEPYEAPDADNAPFFGTVITHPKGFGIVTAYGLFVPHRVQLEGKSPSAAKEFLNGYPDIIGSVLM